MSPSLSVLRLYVNGLKVLGRTRVGRWYIVTVPRLLDPPLLRLTGGRINSKYPLPVMLLTTIGARTGLRRTKPLLYLTDDAGHVLVASNFGGNGHPAWYHNILANPNVEVLAGKYSGLYEATEISEPAEREHAWSLALDIFPEWRDIAGTRMIPLIRLKRSATSGP